MRELSKVSFGVGDRFSHQAKAQLKAIIQIQKMGIEVTPVWNKSNREHITIGTHPGQVRVEADEAVTELNWTKDYFVDADHINMDTVRGFIPVSDFFTIDVSSYIGQGPDDSDLTIFLNKCEKYSEQLNIPGIEGQLKTGLALITSLAQKYLFAAQKASDIYSMIEAKKGKGQFITEISMDEVATPQTPVELFFILFMLAEEKVPLQTIAPRFSGRFNKGVDYVGDVAQFAKEFEEDLLVIDYAVKEFGLNPNLKLSIHSGSDKFSIYPAIGELIQKHDKGIHVKTAGTTWLEEVRGLCLADGDALDFVKGIYFKALGKIDELCAPYADVIDIDIAKLPAKEEVKSWSAQQMADAVCHDKSNPNYNPNLRQLIHVGYKLAAERVAKYNVLLEKHRDLIEDCVFENIYKKHLALLFNVEVEKVLI
jgi:hypothetical protein